MNTLTTPFIRVVLRDGSTTRESLSGLLALLSRETDDVVSFSALRPHQRHAWHSFLVQLAVLSLFRAGLTALPTDEAAWLGLLRGLTPDAADDAPWCLVTPAHRPALLQPPLPNEGLAELKNAVATPDALDMLVTSKNHDLKNGVMASAEADDWLFALVSVQTMDGFLGAGNYGISRMNGGFANRPAIGLAPPGGPGAYLRRDVGRLLAMRRGQVTEGGPLWAGYAEHDGLALVWLRPWDGVTSISVSELDPLYIEICRRIRLVDASGRIVARVGGSKKARIAAIDGGVTGDPWAPIRRDKEAQKVLTVDARGFGYRPLVELMFPRGGNPSPLQVPADSDASEGLMLIARALVRGQGKTEGYHERRVPLSRRVRRSFITTDTDPVAVMAHDRVALAGEMSRVLRYALLALFENGPDKVNTDKNEPQNKARPFIDRFEREVDLRFFEDLRIEADTNAKEDAQRARTTWVQNLFAKAKRILAEADTAASKATRRRYRARVSAEAALHGVARSNPRLGQHLSKSEQKEADDAA